MGTIVINHSRPQSNYNIDDTLTNHTGIISTGFVEVPLNQTLMYPPAMVAVFRCQHESPEARIAWLINGRVFRDSSQSDIQSNYITHDNGSETAILTIPSDPQHNGTQVGCEASLQASREVTPVAILTITTGGSGSN